MLFCLLLFNFSISTAQSSATDLTAQAIFEKVIDYYDPNGIWEQYEGSMQLNSVLEDNIIREDLTINNVEGFYQTVKHLEDGLFTKGRKNGKAFFKINGKEVAPDEIPDEYKEYPYDLTEHSVNMLIEHHTFHFSGPLMLKAARAKLIPKVETKQLFGTKCLAITFEGLPGNYKRGGYNGPITLYVDPNVNYKVHAVYLDNGWYKDGKGMINLYSGEIEINGLKIPARRLYFHAADNSYTFIDAFISLK